MARLTFRARPPASIYLQAMIETAENGDLVLVADDEQNIVDLVAMYLKRAGYRVATARNGDETLAKVRDLNPSLLVLDVMMPGPDGIQVCRSLRRRSDLPIVMLTARSSDIDKVAGLRFGADDYMTKPFNPDELVARVDAILRRSRGGAPQAREEQLSIGTLALDLTQRAALLDGKALTLTPKEFDLLATFARFPNVALDREQLLDLVWGTAFYAIRTVDVHVARLREKLKGSDVRIETVWGTGYRFAIES